MKIRKYSHYDIRIADNNLNVKNIFDNYLISCEKFHPRTPFSAFALNGDAEDEQSNLHAEGRGEPKRTGSAAVVRTPRSVDNAEVGRGGRINRAQPPDRS